MYDTLSHEFPLLPTYSFTDIYLFSQIIIHCHDVTMNNNNNEQKFSYKLIINIYIYNVMHFVAFLLVARESEIFIT